MANSKARSGRRTASANGGRPAAGTASRSVRTVAAVPATPTSRPVTRPAAKAADPEPDETELTEAELAEQDAEPRTGPPLWLQLVSFVLAILGLAISAYETYAHFNGSHLAGCPTGGGTFNCTAVITSPQSMVFGVVPVAILGLAFYVAAVPLFSPWAWRIQRREVHVLRLVSIVVGMGFVMYLIYAELYQIGDVCEYCSGVHIVTFLLFCITVFSAAIWGLGAKRD
jgi:uncharacterized membrane protein